jgi:hypothetical protein
MWTAVQRSTLLREFREKDKLTNYPIELALNTGSRKHFQLSANTVTMDDENYMVWILKPEK